MARRPIQQVEPICAEDGRLAVLTTGREVWPDRSDLQDMPVYRCECGAWVGVHRGTDIPRGYPAGPHLRRARLKAKEAFEPMVQRKRNRDKVSKSAAEMAGFGWLAAQLGIELAACHFDMLDADQCRKVVRLCMGEDRR